jgi:hypothetical protein
MSRKIVGRGVGDQKIFLEGDLRGRGLVCDKGELQMLHDPVHDGMLRDYLLRCTSWSSVSGSMSAAEGSGEYF